MPPDLTADWVQTGELGFAFVVVILCAFLVVYVLRSSAQREQRLFDALGEATKQMSEITAMLQQMKDDFVSRLDVIEGALQIRPVRAKHTSPRRRE